MRLYDQKYKNLAATAMHILKSLVYFEDANPEEMPKLLKKRPGMKQKSISGAK
ncbi:MAG: hypothetical protein HY920_07120 [Elusimicrobia bacterium]|nr:hypothetical protein [Elusimicrobiota bacterium]